MPKIIFDGFCKEEVIFERANAAFEQKYQNLSQLLPRAHFVYLVNAVYLSSNQKSAEPSVILDQDKTRPGGRTRLDVLGCIIANGG